MVQVKSQPYFYIIQEVSSGRYYIGAKGGRDADPSKLLKEGGYLTSSPVVKDILKRGGLSSFAIRRIKLFDTWDKAYEYETRYLRKIKARSNLRVFNRHANDGVLPSFGTEKYKQVMFEKYGVANAMESDELRSRQVKTKASEKWKTTVGRSAVEKNRAYYSDAEWRGTVLRSAIEKRLKNTDQKAKARKQSMTMSNPEWKETVGRDASVRRVRSTDQTRKGTRISTTKQSEAWKKEVGSVARKKQSRTINDPVWIETVGRPAIEKRTIDYKKTGASISARRLSPEWRAENTIICDICSRGFLSANYTRHREKCEREHSISKGN